jgi:arylsulfatase A-like enzyme
LKEGATRRCSESASGTAAARTGNTGRRTGFRLFLFVGEVDYFTRERGGLIDWQLNGMFLKEQGYYTTLIGNDAVRLIDQQDGKQPFFLYFASLASYAPYQATPSAIEEYKSVADPLRRTYSAMITLLDVQVGRIVAELDKKGLRDNTEILFASDNGGATSGLFAQGAKSNEERDKEQGAIEQGQMTPASKCAVRRR